jgi:uncharacterized membrane protein
VNKFNQLWSNLRSSFWFMPSLIVMAGITLAVVLIAADSAGSDRWLAQWPRLFGAGPEGARGMMSTIAGSMMCVDYLTTILARIAPRGIPSSYRYEDGELRVIAKGPSFESLLAASFDQVRSNAKEDVAIMLRLLGALQTIAGLTARPERRRALREQVQWIAELAERTLASTHDRARIDARLARACDAIETACALGPGKHDR